MTVEEIKDKYSMRDILSRLNVPIKRGFCNCPFHAGDNTASLKVYSNSFYCFGCGKGGDIIHFVQLYNNLTFKEACEWISGENLTSKSAYSRAVAETKRRAITARKEALKKRLHDLRLAEYWQIYLQSEPFSDEWCEAYNAWQKGVYEQGEILKEVWGYD